MRLLGMKEAGSGLWEDSPYFQSYEAYKEVIVQSAADKGGDIHWRTRNAHNRTSECSRRGMKEEFRASW